MSARALSVTALLLGLLLVVLGFVAQRRLGWAGVASEPDPWTYTNHMLDAVYGTRFIMRSPTAGEDATRYWIGPKDAEPDPQPVADQPQSIYPHVRLALERRASEDAKWYYLAVQFAPFRQLGALTHREWLDEIGLVRERRRDGSERTLLRVTFGHESGARVAYFYDPEDPDPYARGFGWLRNELYPLEGQASVFYCDPGGLFLPGEAGDGELTGPK